MSNHKQVRNKRMTEYIANHYWGWGMQKIRIHKEHFAQQCSEHNLGQVDTLMFCVIALH